MGTFTDEVLEFNAKAMKRADLVFKYATQDLASDVTKTRAEGGRLPFQTGFLRSSFGATIDVPVTEATYPPEDGIVPPFDPGAIGLTINRAELGQTLYLTFTAVYARRREYGYSATDKLGRKYNDPPAAFVRSYIAWWDLYVEEAAKDVISAVP